MSAKKKSRFGRATPKGTENPVKTGKPKRTDLPEAPSGGPPQDTTGTVGKQSGKVLRPNRNRGNR